MYTRRLQTYENLWTLSWGSTLSATLGGFLSGGFVSRTSVTITIRVGFVVPDGEDEEEDKEDVAHEVADEIEQHIKARFPHLEHVFVARI